MKYITLLTLIFATTLSAQNKSWPEASISAVAEMIKKYGQPDLQNSNLAIWRDRGIWKSIEVTAVESHHNFPIVHTDVLSQCVSYQVPAEKMDELAAFSGSIVADRTRGLMCARCDSEANNILSLNLAHEVISGAKTVDQARTDFGNIVRQRMNGANPSFMQRLHFEIAPSANPDQNTTGLTKSDVIKISQKRAKIGR